MTDENRARGYHLAMAAAMRILAAEIAKLADPDATAEWFTAVGQQAFDYVDRTSNPSLSSAEEKTAKEAAYETLRMIFDLKGFES